MKIKKLFCILLAMLLALLSGCTGSNEEVSIDTKSDEVGGAIVINNIGYMDNFNYHALSKKNRNKNIHDRLHDG